MELLPLYGMLKRAREVIARKLCEPGTGVLPDTESAGTMVLDFSAQNCKK